MPVLTQNTRNRGHISSGGRLVGADGRTLPLRNTRLRATAGGGIARTLLSQTFHNPHAEPLTVTYQLPLPADGAVSAFAFQIGDRRIEGEIDRRAAARERFEEAIATGHSAALLEEDRASLFTQEIGNIPPGAEIVAEITVDQPLAWLEDGMWEWRFPTAVAPRYLGAAGRVPDSDKVTVDVTRGEVPGRLDFELAIEDMLADGMPSSQSHQVHSTTGEGTVRVALADGAARQLDRDVVVRWPVATAEVGASLRVTRTDDEAYGLLTIVPPRTAGDPVARDVIALIDTSGSMHGEPLAQAKLVVSAIVRSLAAKDRLELIEFSTQPRRFKSKPVAMTEAARAAALRWIASLEAGGATEMHSAIKEALLPIGAEAQRQVVLVTDGMIGFEREIVSEILGRLPTSSRVHTVGVGDAVNRSLTAGAARAGRGVEAILGIGEDPEPAARRIVARTAAPAVVDLAIEGSAVLDHAPLRLPDLFAGAPARIAVRLRDTGGELCVRGRTAEGSWEHTLVAPPVETGTGRPEIRALHGRETVEDLEMQIAAGGPVPELDAKIEAIGLNYRLATRLTSWIAVSSEVTVDPRQPSRRERVPHELPNGMSIAGLGLRESVEFDRLTAMPCVAPMDAIAAEEATFPVFDRTRAEKRGLPGRIFGGGPRDADPELEEGLGDFDDFAEFCDVVTPMELSGRVTLDRDGSLVVEIESSGFDWQLPDRVRVCFDDGTTVEAEVVAEHSTAAGHAPSGTLLRLFLRLPDGEPTATPGYVELEIAGQGFTVQLG